ncbi:MAG: hypothetical protein ACRDI2_08845, partial [Chloroflexota bacterium]
GADVREARHVPELSPLLGHAWLARASLYDTAMALADGGAERERADNPYLQDYPWRAAYPELQPEAPERALGFDFWFAALRDRTPFLEYWSALVACWLALALVPLATRLRSAARCHTSEVAMPRPHTTERVVKVAPA